MSQSASETIRALYTAINRRDVEGAIAFIDDDCLYQDFNFPQPFQGKAAVQALFKESCEKVPKALQFVIDDITTGDPLATGLTWHVELDGIPFPNGRGASFYRLSETTGKVIFARDVVEPPIKPGRVAFSIIRLASPLVRRFLKGR
ncbi:MAG: nuclear transport factor 2 family protein [Cyanobacteria bacterium P01_G01_bin.38]